MATSQKNHKKPNASQKDNAQTDVSVEALFESKTFHSINELWIPCTQHLPDLNAVVMVSVDTGLVAPGHREENRWWVDKWPYTESRVLAWMPMPRPYVGKHSETAEETAESDEQETENQESSTNEEI